MLLNQNGPRYPPSNTSSIQERVKEKERDNKRRRRRSMDGTLEKLDINEG